MRIFARLMRGQLKDMRAALSGALNCPFHHFFSKSLVSMILVYAHRFDLSAQATLKADRGKEHEMQCSDHLPISFSNNKLMGWIVIDLFKRHIIRHRYR